MDYSRDLQSPEWGQTVILRGKNPQNRMSALGGGFNRSTQHLLILLEKEVCDGGDCTDMVHAAADIEGLRSDVRFTPESGHRRMSAACLLYPRKRTLGLVCDMSALCQEQT
jgi:hypothetical protein